MTESGELADLLATRGTVVADVIAGARAADVRARLTGYTRYALLDRGSYAEAAAPHEPELCAALAALAAQIVGRELQLVSARALRLGAGDYVLARGDRVDSDEVVEVMLDLSPAAVPGADVHYRRNGRVFFRFASQPGAVAIVVRGAGVACNHVYVSKRHADAELVRLVLVLR